MFQSGTAVLGRASQVQRHGAWSEFFAVVRLAVRTRMTRRDLPELTDRMLADIGVSRPVALAEAARRPWDLAPRRQG